MTSSSKWRKRTSWGAERVQGELLKLGIAVAKRTIQRYMRPVRSHGSGQTWATFLKTHAKDVWACDFLPVVDLFFRQAFVFFIIELNSRRVVHFAVTRTPSEVWVAQQLREATPFGQGPKYLIRDNDNKFGTRFDELEDIEDRGAANTLPSATSERDLRALPGQCAEGVPGSHVDC